VRKTIMMFAMLVGLTMVMGMSPLTTSDVEAKIYRNVKRHKVELYVTSWCPYCKKAKEFFDQRGIAYSVYDIEHDPAAARRKSQLDTGRGVPLAVINGIKISGWSQQAYQAALEQ